MNNILCFGELLLRLSPALNRQWLQQAAMPVFMGGAELNVAGALALWDLPVKYCTALPDYYLTNELLEELQSKNIDTSAVLKSGNRIGTYYLPQGADLKNAGVIYDRAGSSFATLQPGIIDWDDVLKDCNWFHFSAISPAVSLSAAAVCLEALKACAAKKITVSVDLNYRAKLWQYGKQPAEVMTELMPYCNIIMGNLWAAESLLNIKSPIADSNGISKDALINAAGESMLQLHRQYPQATTFAYTFRLADHYWAVLQHGREMMISKEYDTDNAVDKAGSGDCFMAGLIYGMNHQFTPQQTVDFASVAATGKLYEKGDRTHQTVEQVKARMI
jgi:2-dehydro-3-deoxygluconokinase